LLLQLTRAGIFPKKHVLDNKVSENMKNHICDTCKMNMELVPPGCHRQNVAKLAICNFKAHFLSVLAGVANDFPQHLWDRLLPQTEITLNLIWQSNATPTVSAYAHLSGPFEYNKMLLAPMGCEAQIHKKTNKRGTWAYHSVDGWYLFTSPEHYPTHTCYVKATKSEHYLDTVRFKHKNITNPTITNADKVMQALVECVKTITGATGGTTAQDAKDLQRIVKATRAALHKNDATINNSNPEHQAPRVPKLPRVHALLRVPPTTAENQRITRAKSDAQHGKQSSISGNRVPFPDSDSQNRKQSSVSGNRVPFPAGRSDSDSQNRKQSSVSGNIVPSPAGKSDPDSQIGKQSSVSGNRVPYPDADSQHGKQSSVSGNRVPFPAIGKVINKTISALTTMPTSALTPEPTTKPNSVPTTSATQDRLRKQRIA
jgi:hypothetical protein